MIKNQTLFAFLFKGAVVAALVGLPAALSAQDAWFPSKYGQQDTLGAANNLSASHVLKASRLITQGKAYSLGVDISSESPPLPSGPREYKLSLVQPAKGSAGTLAHHANGKGITQGANKLTANADFLTIWMGIGTQIEGLGHIGIDNLYYNGVDASDFVTGNGVTKYSIHEVPPIVSRAVLLDIAAVTGKASLPGGYAISAEEIQLAEKSAGIRVEEGDVVLIHTGWLASEKEVKQSYGGKQPGLGVAAALYLADKNIVAIGADNDGVEAIPAEDPNNAFPVHTELITKNGIYLMENVWLDELARDKATEFLFVLGQPKFVGAVQAVVNPIAIR